MMKRHSKEQIAKNPALKTRDMEEARKSCEQLLSQPFTLLNYLEGTRFTQEKHAQQQSPYQNLLKPKAGGLALALSILGNDIDALVDMTIVYPDGAPGYSEFWLGKSHGLRSIYVKLIFLHGYSLETMKTMQTFVNNSNSGSINFGLKKTS
jgi:1-acyl-sn-glycerol-3-phosphate acyltransferase